MGDESLEFQKIRLEVLKMACDMLDYDYTRNRDLVLSEYYNKIGTENQIPIPSDLPKMATPAKIISLAEKLNAFVTNSNKQS